jgi:prepilin-type N-terminal cleavage/methylation domain-containing protein
LKIKNLKFKISQGGFTLIELLIVIALLGALAVGLLATVDPFEQLKKGTDTSTRNTTTEVYNAAIRYYAVKTAMPWDVNLTAMSLDSTAMTDPSSGYLQLIINAGELKPEFIQLAGSGNLSQIKITSTADTNDVRQNVAVCFLPASKSFANEANAKYASDSTLGTSCPGTGGTGAACYWCIK